MKGGRERMHEDRWRCDCLWGRESEMAGEPHVRCQNMRKRRISGPEPELSLTAPPLFPFTVCSGNAGLVNIHGILVMIWAPIVLMATASDQVYRWPLAFEHIT